MQNSSHSTPLPSLLSILKKKKHRSSIKSVVNRETIELTRQLLFMKDYVNVAAQLRDEVDIKILLDFMLYLLRNGHLSHQDAKLDANRRARRFMFKVITKTPVIPASLFVTGVKTEVHREIIGGGGFGLVFKGKLGKRAVALKVLYKTHNNVDFCREALMWRSLNHQFVLPFLGIYETGSKSQFFLVSPYMENGTLSRWRKKVPRSTVDIERLLLEVAQGIEYIHSEGVVHGDLRGDNVLLDANFHVQIADFGLTRYSESTVTRSGAGHYNFAAPELFGIPPEGDLPLDDGLLSTARTQKSDVYAFGCLYYEIQYDDMPFAGSKDIQIMKMISRGEHPPRRDQPPLSDRAWNLIQWCWVRDAAKRPAIGDIRKTMMAWTRHQSVPPNSPGSAVLQIPETSRGRSDHRTRTLGKEKSTATNIWQKIKTFWKMFRFPGSRSAPSHPPSSAYEELPGHSPTHPVNRFGPSNGAARAEGTGYPPGPELHGLKTKHPANNRTSNRPDPHAHRLQRVYSGLPEVC